MKSHPTDLVSLGFGLLFLGIPSLWMTSWFVDLTGAVLAWALAGGLVVLGGLGIAQALRPSRPSRSSGPSGTSAPSGPHAPDRDGSDGFQS